MYGVQIIDLYVYFKIKLSRPKPPSDLAQNWAQFSQQRCK